MMVTRTEKSRQEVTLTKGEEMLVLLSGEFKTMFEKRLPWVGLEPCRSSLQCNWTALPWEPLKI